MTQQSKLFIGIMLLTAIASVIAMPERIPLNFSLFGKSISYEVKQPVIDFSFFGTPIYKKFELKRGLDIQGGMQVVLNADMSEIEQVDHTTALESAREIILRRVDLFGLAEPNVKSVIAGDQYRLVVELPGLDDPQAALDLVGQTAKLSFELLEYGDFGGLMGATESGELEASQSAQGSIAFAETGLTGGQLNRAMVQFDPTTGEPVISLEFNEEGTQLFSEITTNNTGKQLAILIDGIPLMAPTIQVPIVTGQATITGGFTLEEAQKMSIQLNAGALPVPITVLEQRTVAATLGAESVQKSLYAGIVGIALVMLFMIIYYGFKGFLASLALLIYSVLTIAVYKIIGITVTLPGLAGLVLSIGMAVDANILIFERMKEELRLEKPFAIALELGFGRAWDSIKDANLATIITALVLINPLELSFLNSAGLVRGFGITLLIGVFLSLFTGVVVTRTFMRLFLKG